MKKSSSGLEALRGRSYLTLDRLHTRSLQLAAGLLPVVLVWTHHLHQRQSVIDRALGALLAQASTHGVASASRAAFEQAIRVPFPFHFLHGAAMAGATILPYEIVLNALSWIGVLLSIGVAYLAHRPGKALV